MSEIKHKERFPGFPSNWGRNYWKYPRVLDEYRSLLTGSEEKILTFILRQTFGFGKVSDRITSPQFEKGIGEYNKGTGLSKTSVKRGLKKLEKMGFIWKKRVGYWVNEFGPVMVSKEQEDGVKNTQDGVKNTPMNGAKNGYRAIEDNNRELSIEKKIEATFSLYKEKICPDIRLTKEGEKLIGARLKEYTPRDLERAIDNFSKNTWWMENHSSNIRLFFKSEEQINRFMNLQPSPENKKTERRRGRYNPD